MVSVCFVLVRALEIKIHFLKTNYLTEVVKLAENRYSETRSVQFNFHSK